MGHIFQDGKDHGNRDVASFQFPVLVRTGRRLRFRLRFRVNVRIRGLGPTLEL